MRTVVNILAALAFLGGLAALGYALIGALPYWNSELNAPLLGVVYQKAMFYGIVSIACFGLTGLLIAAAGSVYRPKSTV